MKRALTVGAVLACWTLGACQALLDLEDARAEGDAAPASNEAGASDDAIASADVDASNGGKSFTCPTQVATTFCTNFEEAMPQGTWPNVSVDKATLTYDVIDGGNDAGTTMLVTTLEVGAVAQLRANDVLSRFLHCELDWNVEATSPTAGAFALVTILGGFDTNTSENDIRLDIDTTRRLESVVEDGDTRTVAGGVLGWNHTVIEIDRGDGDAGSGSMVVTVNNVVNKRHPLPLFEKFNSIRVGPDFENAGWRLRYDNVICTGSD